MLIRIDHLPGDVTERDVRYLCHPTMHVESVCFCNSGNCENVLAWISVEMNFFAANSLVERLDGIWWHERHLDVTLTPYPGGSDSPAASRNQHIRPAINKRAMVLPEMD